MDFPADEAVVTHSARVAFSNVVGRGYGEVDVAAIIDAAAGDTPHVRAVVKNPPRSGWPVVRLDDQVSLTVVCDGPIPGIEVVLAAGWGKGQGEHRARLRGRWGPEESGCD